MLEDQFSSLSSTIYSIPVIAPVGTTQLIAGMAAIAGGVGTGIISTAAKAIEVVGFYLTAPAAGAGTFQLIDPTAVTNLTGVMTIPASGSLKWDAVNSSPIGSTAAGNPLSIVVTGEPIAGFLLYTLV